MDPIAIIINKLIQNNLPAINAAIHDEIIKRNLDPMAHVTSDDSRLGSIDLGICTAYVDAGYDVNNLAGLSSCHINTLEVTSSGNNPQNNNEVNGNLSINASINGISASVGGHVGGGCGFISKNIGLSGSVSASAIQASGSGSFQAQINGQQLCLNSIRLNQLSLSYSDLNVNIDGLGFFNDFIRPLENLILDQFNGAISSLIASALTPVLNSEVSGILPLCTNLS